MDMNNANRSILGLAQRMYRYQKRKWVALAGLLLFLLFSNYLFTSVDYFKYRDVAKPDVLNLELAFTASNFANILSKWNNIEAFKRSTAFLDSLFPIVYSTFFAFAFAVCRGTRNPEKRDLVFFLAPFGAALCDYCENAGMLFELRNMNNRTGVITNDLSGPVIFAASTFAAIKFAIMLAVFASIIIAIGRRDLEQTKTMAKGQSRN